MGDEQATWLEFIGVVKLIHRPSSEGPNLIDFGGRVVKQAGRAALSGEYLERLIQKDAADETTSERVTINRRLKLGITSDAR